MDYHIFDIAMAFQANIDQFINQAFQMNNATVLQTPSSSIEGVTPDAVTNSISTLIGAIIGAVVGAILVYFFQRRFQRAIEHKAALTAGHQLIFSLFQQVNTILLIQRDYVQYELQNPGRFISIPATPHFDTKKNTLELPELYFLLHEKEGREILYDFYLAQQNYIEALNQWNLRSTLHLDKIQPALASAGFRGQAELTMKDIEEILGIQNLGAIINSTNNCIETLGRAYKKLFPAYTRTRTYLIKRFNTTDFTEFECPETYGLDK